MKTLYFECNMGAAGDMLMASLLELHDNPQEFLHKLNNIGIPGVKVSAQPSVKHGITGTYVKVTINGIEESEDMHSHEHEHSHGEHTHDHSHDEHDEHSHSHGTQGHSHGSYQDITHLIGHLIISDEVKKNAIGVYKLIAEAESHAHGVEVTQIHFHEVGEMDAIADIVGICMLIEELALDRILASPVHVGSGHVRCAHGVLPVPAPATAFILKGAPIYGGDIRGELCTPTGAAILKHFASDFGSMPIMRVAKIGYGMGKKDFERANCVRSFLGETGRGNAQAVELACPKDVVVELSCNLDDVTPEAIAFAQQLLMDEGALDVYTSPIGMKKGRAGVLLTCMCKPDLKDKMLHLIFKHTTTLGIRENISHRYILNRRVDEVQTEFGVVRVKTAHGYEVTKSKPEYEDIAKIAKDKGLSLAEVLIKI